MEVWNENEDTCQNISSKVTHSNLDLEDDDRVLRVLLNNQYKLKAPIATYTCTSRLKPIPLVRA